MTSTKRFPNSVVLLIALTGFILSTPVFAEDVDYRLSKAVQPTMQRIDLNLNPDNADYQGTTVIDLTVHSDVDTIGLYWLGPKVEAIRLKSADGERSLTAEDDEYDIHRLGDGSKIAKGDYQLTMKFTADFSTDALGLYRTEYQDKNYLFTQFESLYARRAFPLFDEPDFKIPYQLTLTVPKGMEVATNTPAIKESVDGSTKTVVFDVSPPMPSYLLALTVGPLDKTPITGLSVPGFIYSPAGSGGETGFVVKHTPTILKVLEDYFGIDYPYKKLDFVAVPDYAFGAMENAGLVTYRTELLLVGDEATGNVAQRSLYVIAHELAHMWYGDLVTMKWWDDLWLNEAFATWMGQKVMSTTYPQYQSDLDLPQTRAFGEDALAATKAIRKEAKTDKDIEDGMGLNYSKGHAILNMFEQQIGEQAFQKSVQQYMQEFRWKNTVANDLWQAFADQSDQDISAIAGTYLNQPGYPLVSFAADGKVSQARYRNYGTDVQEQNWQVPLAIKYKQGGEIKYTKLVSGEDELNFKEARKADWFFPVQNGNGYYRWQIPADKYAALLSDLGSLTNREKMALLSNSTGLLNSGNISIGEHLSMLTELAKDDNAIVVLNVIEELKLIGEKHTDLQNQTAFSNYITQVLTPWYERIGSKTRASDGDDILSMRPRLLRTLGQLGDNPALNKELVSLAHAYLKGDAEIDDNLGREAIRIAAMLDEGDLAKTYYQTYLATDDATLKSNIMAGLYFSEKEAVTYSLEQTFNDKIPAGDKSNALTGAFYIHKDQGVLYDWLSDNFDEYVKAIPENYRGYLPFMMSPGCQPQNVERLAAFFKGKGDIYQAALTKSLEGENNCLTLKQREQKSFNDFLAAYR